LNITVPIKNVLLKQIDVLFTGLFLKINAPSVKFLLVIDLLNEVDFENLRNRIQLLDDKLEIFLIKKEAGLHWDTLSIRDLDKKEIKERRDESLRQYYERQDQKYKETETKKH